jgi:serine/threonine protein kinase
MVENSIFKITDDLENLGPLGKSSGSIIGFFKGRRMGSALSAVEVFFIPGAPDEWYAHFEEELNKWREVSEERHAKLSRVINSGFTAGGYPFIEIEFIDGKSLEEKLNEGFSFTMTEVANIAEQVSRTLAHCHNVGLLHGGICTDNIFLHSKNRNFILTGFGLSMLDQEQRKEALALDFSGTMAPEQKNGNLLAESDVFRFGMMMYEVVIGGKHKDSYKDDRFPGTREAFHEHLVRKRHEAQEGAATKPGSMEELPLWISDMIFRCVQQDPASRFRNGIRLYDFILLSNRPVAAKQMPAEASRTIEQLSLIETRKRPVQEKKTKKKEDAPTAVRKQVVALPKMNKKTSRSALLVSSILLAVMIVIGLYSYQQKKRNINQSAMARAEDTSRILPTSESKLITRAPAVQTEKALPHPEQQKVQKKKAVKANDKIANANKIIIHPWKPEGTTIDNHTGLGAYRVVSKAYFYTEPNELTRRNAFIVHWNNAILHPIEEQNDFIYIVYTNNEGQTSKGWIRKKDIVRVDR